MAIVTTKRTEETTVTVDKDELIAMYLERADRPEDWHVDIEYDYTKDPYDGYESKQFKGFILTRVVEY